jgi:bifunctional enzyme CysN/CysC
MRQGLCRDLGFTADERSENLRRSAEVAKILNDSGLICIAAFVAPHAAVRHKAREVIGPDRFLEIYLKAPLEVLKARDKSGAYKAAEAGKIAQFPGVSAAFEEPTTAELVLETDKLNVEQCVDAILRLLDERGLA